MGVLVEKTPTLFFLFVLCQHESEHALTLLLELNTYETVLQNKVFIFTSTGNIFTALFLQIYTH